MLFLNLSVQIVIIINSTVDRDADEQYQYICNQCHFVWNVYYKIYCDCGELYQNLDTTRLLKISQP